MRCIAIREEEPHFLMQTYGSTFGSGNGRTKQDRQVLYRSFPGYSANIYHTDSTGLSRNSFLQAARAGGVQPVCTECATGLHKRTACEQKKLMQPVLIFLSGWLMLLDKLVLSCKVTVRKELGFSPASAYKACGVIFTPMSIFAILRKRECGWAVHRKSFYRVRRRVNTGIG